MKNPAVMQVAYCRTCRSAIAAGPIPVSVVAGRRRAVPTSTPSHVVKGKRHDDVGLLEVDPEDWPTGKPPELVLKILTDKFKSQFK